MNERWNIEGYHVTTKQSSRTSPIRPYGPLVYKKLGHRALIVAIVPPVGCLPLCRAHELLSYPWIKHPHFHRYPRTAVPASTQVRYPDALACFQPFSLLPCTLPPGATTNHHSRTGIATFQQGVELKGFLLKGFHDFSLTGLCQHYNNKTQLHPCCASHASAKAGQRKGGTIVE